MKVEDIKDMLFKFLDERGGEGTAKQFNRNILTDPINKRNNFTLDTLIKNEIEGDGNISEIILSAFGFSVSDGQDKWWGLSNDWQNFCEKQNRPEKMLETMHQKVTEQFHVLREKKGGDESMLIDGMELNEIVRLAKIETKKEHSLFGKIK